MPQIPLDGPGAGIGDHEYSPSTPSIAVLVRGVVPAHGDLCLALTTLREDDRKQYNQEQADCAAAGEYPSWRIVVNCHSAAHSMSNLRPLPGTTPAAAEDDYWHRHPRHAGKRHSSKADVVPPRHAPLPVRFGPCLNRWMVTPLAAGRALVLAEDYAYFVPV